MAMGSTLNYDIDVKTIDFSTTCSQEDLVDHHVESHDSGPMTTESKNKSSAIKICSDRYLFGSSFSGDASDEPDKNKNVSQTAEINARQRSNSGDDNDSNTSSILSLSPEPSTSEQQQQQQQQLKSPSKAPRTSHVYRRSLKRSKSPLRESWSSEKRYRSRSPEFRSQIRSKKARRPSPPRSRSPILIPRSRSPILIRGSRSPILIPRSRSPTLRPRHPGPRSRSGSRNCRSYEAEMERCKISRPRRSRSRSREIVTKAIYPPSDSEKQIHQKQIPHQEFLESLRKMAFGQMPPVVLADRLSSTDSQLATGISTMLTPTISLPMSNPRTVLAISPDNRHFSSSSITPEKVNLAIQNSSVTRIPVNLSSYSQVSAPSKNLTDKVVEKNKSSSYASSAIAASSSSSEPSPNLGSSRSDFASKWIPLTESFSPNSRTSTPPISLTPELSRSPTLLPENDQTTDTNSRSSTPENPPQKSTTFHLDPYQSDSSDVEILEQIQNPIKTKTLGLQLPKPVSAHLPRQKLPVPPELPLSSEQVFKDPDPSDISSLYELLIHKDLLANEATYSALTCNEEYASTTLSCIAEIRFLALQTSKAEILTELSLLGFKMGLSFKGIILEQNRNFCDLKAKIVFNSKLLALGFYRQTDGKFLSKKRNVSFSPINLSEEFNQILKSNDIILTSSSSDLCCISMTYSQASQVETGSDYRIKSMCATYKESFLFACTDIADDSKLSTLSQKLVYLVKDQNEIESISKDGILLLFEDWKQARVFWSCIQKLDNAKEFNKTFTDFGIYSEKSVPEIMKEMEFQSCLDFNSPTDRCIAMDSFLSKIVGSYNLKAKNVVGTCRPAKELPQSLSRIWHENVTVCFLGLRFVMVNGEPRITQLSICGEKIIPLTLFLDPDKPNSETDGLKQLMCFLKSLQSELILCLPSSFICLPVLLHALQRSQDLDLFYSLLVGVSDIFTLLNTKSLRLLETSQKCLLNLDLRSLYITLKGPTHTPSAQETDASIIQFIFNEFLDNAVDQKKFISTKTVPIEWIKIQQHTCIEIQIPEKTSIESGEILEVKVQPDEHVFKKALFVETTHEVKDISICQFEWKTNEAILRVQNTSNDSITFDRQLTIGTLLPHPKSLVCPENVNFLGDKQIYALDEKISAMKPSFEEEDLPSKLNVHIFEGGSLKPRKTTNVTIHPMPPKSYKTMFVSMRIEEEDRNLQFLHKTVNRIYDGLLQLEKDFCNKFNTRG